MDTLMQPNTKSLFKFIVFFLKPYLKWVTLFVLVAIAAGLMMPMESYFYKRLINELSQVSTDTSLVNKIIWSTLLILVAMKLHLSCWRIFNVIKLKTAATYPLHITG
jgi:hypothetical protein